MHRAARQVQARRQALRGSLALVVGKAASSSSTRRTVPVSFSGTAAGNGAPVCAFVLFTLPSSRVDKTPEAAPDYRLMDEYLTE